MKQNLLHTLSLLAVLVIILAACAPTATPVPPTATPRPSDTPVPLAPTATSRPSDTPVPPARTATTTSTPPVLPTAIATPIALASGGTGSGKSEVEITFICNEGFLLTSSRGEKILVDAFVGTAFPSYGVLSPEQRALIAEALPPFDKVDLILITHDHADHLDFELVKNHMQKNPRAMLVSTAKATSALKDLFPDRTKSLSLAEGKKETFTLNGIEVTAVGLRHSPPIGDFLHVGYLFNFGGWRILHMGDSEDTDKLPSDFGNLDLAFIGYPTAKPPPVKHIIKMHWKVPAPYAVMQKWILK